MEGNVVSSCHTAAKKNGERELDIWEGEYTYRCILTNDYESSARDIVEFYNLRGGKAFICRTSF